ncbi:glycosyltransferase family 2 protein [Verrucomicrobiota bacterium]
MNKEKEFCVIVPGYQEEGRIGEVVEGIRKYCDHVVVVDDGSIDGTADEAEKAGATVLRHEVNKGKGIALNTGFQYARDNGFEFVITMDADGQHDPEEISLFVDAYKKTGTPAIVGNRMSDPRTMPFVRRCTNRFMSWLLSRKMGQHVPDTQNGYRLYKTDIIPDMGIGSDRFAAESEILLQIAEKGARIDAVPVRIIYGDEKSKINPVKDAIRFFGMLRKYKKNETASGRSGEAESG